LKVERESQFNTAGGSVFQVRGAAVLNDRLAKWCPSKWHAQQWDGRRSSVACDGAGCVRSVGRKSQRASAVTSL